MNITIFMIVLHKLNAYNENELFGSGNFNSIEYVSMKNVLKP